MRVTYIGKPGGTWHIADRWATKFGIGLCGRTVREPEFRDAPDGRRCKACDRVKASREA